ncbi:MAG: hypothetical protein A3J31_00230 [Candidatus Taylorbacteria bacterium RIFCSPLOWO2_02_FULL_48_16]|nr:MAG: hypothetical protein A3J31_00230 [Candidatus Taylorbacteria bacterium RIFCSPLOWO2_02_FULL_48_16]
MNEIVYILTNEAMPDYIKIGKTNNVVRRIQDLDWTNIPLPFQCYYAARVKDASFAETQIHSIFADNRVRSNREFFKVNPERVVAAIKLIELENVTPKNDNGEHPEVKEELEKIYTKRYNFKAADIPVGTELTFTRNPSVKARVVANSNIEINGETKSLSRAARDLLGYSYAVAGPLYWMYEDETLDERRKRIEGGE